MLCPIYEEKYGDGFQTNHNLHFNKQPLVQSWLIIKAGKSLLVLLCFDPINLNEYKLTYNSACHPKIPLAPMATSVGGLSFQRKDGFNGSLRYRYMGDRPANENKSVIAKGYFITDAILNYTKSGYSIGLSVENIFNQRWNETQFNTESRLINEAQPVTEIHFTSGTPVGLKLRLSKTF